VYAIFQTGGKQYEVSPGSIINVEKITANPGDQITFDQVLLLKEDDKPAQIGRPYLDNVSIQTEVVSQTRGDKIMVYDFKRRHGEHKKTGHRQDYTCVKIVKIG